RSTRLRLEPLSGGRARRHVERRGSRGQDYRWASVLFPLSGPTGPARTHQANSCFTGTFGRIGVGIGSETRTAARSAPSITSVAVAEAPTPTCQSFMGASHPPSPTSTVES